MMRVVVEYHQAITENSDDTIVLDSFGEEIFYSFLIFLSSTDASYMNDDVLVFMFIHPSYFYSF